MVVWVRRRHSADRLRRLIALCVSATLLSASLCPPPALGSLQEGAPAPALDLTQLDVASVVVPEALGWVAESWQPTDRSPAALVIHLQDLHTHPEAQAHLSELIRHLREQLGLQLIALEGAEGLCDTTLYSDFPDPSSTKRLATLFLQEGLFTGAEHYAITHPGEVTLWGVEDDALYRQHLATYQQGAARQAEAEAVLRRLRERLIPLRKTRYPKTLRRLLQIRDAYERDEDDSFQPYLTKLQRLAKTATLDLKAYPHLDAAAQAHTLRLRLDMNLVKGDADHLLESLRPRLRRSEQDRLTQLAEAVTAKRVPAAHYYQTLAHIAQAHRIRLQATPSQAQDTAGTLRLLSALLLGTAPPARTDYRVFRQYLAYLQLSDQIRSGALAEELDALDDAVEHAYLTTEQQQTLARLIQQVTLLDDLIHVQLSPAGHRQYQRSKSALTVQALATALSQVTDQTPATQRELQQLVDALPTQERFYELAMKRDEALIRNTLRQLEERSTNAAILIAGGFHTPGMTASLKRQRIAYLVVTPRVDGQFDESRYHAGLENALPPLTDILKKVDQAVLQTPLSSSQHSPPTTGKLPNGPVGRQDSQDYTFPTKRHAVFFYWLNAKIDALRRQFSDWADQLNAWIKSHPREAAMYGIALTLVGSKVLLTAMGIDMEFDITDGALLAMATPTGPGEPPAAAGGAGPREPLPGTPQPIPAGSGTAAAGGGWRGAWHRLLKREPPPVISIEPPLSGPDFEIDFRGRRAGTIGYRIEQGVLKLDTLYVEREFHGEGIELAVTQWLLRRTQQLAGSRSFTVLVQAVRDPTLLNMFLTNDLLDHMAISGTVDQDYLALTAEEWQARYRHHPPARVSVNLRGTLKANTPAPALSVQARDRPGVLPPIPKDLEFARREAYVLLNFLDFQPASLRDEIVENIVQSFRLGTRRASHGGFAHYNKTWKQIVVGKHLSRQVTGKQPSELGGLPTTSGAIFAHETVHLLQDLYDFGFSGGEGFWKAETVPYAVSMYLLALGQGPDIHQAIRVFQKSRYADRWMLEAFLTGYTHADPAILNEDTIRGLLQGVFDHYGENQQIVAGSLMAGVAYAHYVHSGRWENGRDLIRSWILRTPVPGLGRPGPAAPETPVTEE